MVFYQPPKRGRRSAQPHKPGPILLVPDELMLQILEPLDMESVLKARLSCSFLLSTCNTIVQGRLQTLYLHSSPKALRNALDICAHSTFSQGIREIILLGTISWSDIERAYPGYRQDGIINSEERRSSRPIYPYHRSSAWKTRFRSWPIELTPNGSGTIRTQHEPEDWLGHLHDMFPTAYAPLISALSRLPRLQKLAFEERLMKPGLNQVPLTVLQKHAADVAKMAAPTGDDLRLSDADVLYGLLLSPDLHFTAIRQSKELPFTDYLTRRLCQQLTPFTAATTLGSLTSIDAVLDLGWANTDSHLLYQQLCHRTSTTLERLRIEMIPNASVMETRNETILRTILDVTTFPKLQRLTLEKADERPMGGREHRRYRPSCHDFDMSDFLRRHVDTLTHVSIGNIIFADARIERYISPTEMLSQSLKTMKASSSLESMTWTIDAYWHDPRCKRLDSDPVNCHKHNCGYYHISWSDETSTGDMFIAAQQHGLKSDKSSCRWDFGDVVMRQKMTEDGEEA